MVGSHELEGLFLPFWFCDSWGCSTLPFAVSLFHTASNQALCRAVMAEMKVMYQLQEHQMLLSLCCPTDDGQKRIARGSIQAPTLPALLPRPARSRPVPHHMHSAFWGLIVAFRMRDPVQDGVQPSRTSIFDRGGNASLKCSISVHLCCAASSFPCVSMETGLTSVHCTHRHQK